MSRERSGGLPGEIHARKEGPEDLPLDLSPSDSPSELFDQLSELGAATLQRLLR